MWKSEGWEAQVMGGEQMKQKLNLENTTEKEQEKGWDGIEHEEVTETDRPKETKTKGEKM